MGTIELNEGEELLATIQGDYWEKLFLFLYDQKRGTFWITNQRVLFQGGFITSFEAPIEEIESVQTCMVGPLIHFIPTGINVRMRSGKAYRMSVMKRKQYIDLIDSMLMKQ